MSEPERATFYVCPAGFVDTCNQVATALGLGEPFRVPLRPVGSNGPATHYCGSHAGMPQNESLIFMTFSDGGGTLPEGPLWGQDGLPNEGQAKAAVATVSASMNSGPDLTAEGNMAAQLASMNPPLEVIEPDLG
jgi:hypothetical protein